METLVTRVDDALQEPSSREGWRDALENALARAINECSAENLANRPDFVLGMFLSDCLFAFSRAINAYTPPGPLVLQHVITCHACSALIGYCDAPTPAMDGTICGNCLDQHRQ